MILEGHNLWMKSKSKRKGGIVTIKNSPLQMLNYICSQNEVYRHLNMDEQRAGYGCQDIFNTMERKSMRMKVIRVSTSV